MGEGAYETVGVDGLIPAGCPYRFANFEVGQHSVLLSVWPPLSRTYDRGVQAVLSWVSQGEGLPIEGDAHNKLAWVSTLLHPMFHGEVCVLTGILVITPEV